MTDAVALLDLCHGFADKITLSPEEEPWARPVFTQSVDGEGSEIVIKNGRFGIDTGGSVFSQCGPGTMIPNDTISPSSKPLTVISGINGSGKTIYIKQIALIVLLAHCGCYVPAESAQIPVRFTSSTAVTRDCFDFRSSYLWWWVFPFLLFYADNTPIVRSNGHV